MATLDGPTRESKCARVAATRLPIGKALPHALAPRSNPYHKTGFVTVAKTRRPSHIVSGHPNGPDYWDTVTMEWLKAYLEACTNGRTSAARQSIDACARFCRPTGAPRLSTGAVVHQMRQTRALPWICMRDGVRCYDDVASSDRALVWPLVRAFIEFGRTEFHKLAASRSVRPHRTMAATRPVGRVRNLRPLAPRPPLPAHPSDPSLAMSRSAASSPIRSRATNATPRWTGRRGRHRSHEGRHGVWKTALDSSTV